MRKETLGKVKCNPPAAEAKIGRAFEKLGVAPRPELLDMYRSYDGLREIDGEVHFRLMPLAEVVETHLGIREALEMFPLLEEFHLRMFWSDDQSNHLGMFMAGPLAGKICCFEHDGYSDGDLSPVFGAADSAAKALGKLEQWNRIIEQIDENPRLASRLNREDFPYLDPGEGDRADTHCLTWDYPRGVSTVPEDTEAWQWAKQAMGKLPAGEGAGDKRRFLHNTFAKLAPESELPTLHKLLLEKDPVDNRQLLHNLYLRAHPSSLPAIVALATRDDDSSALMTLAKWVFTNKPDAKTVLAQFKASGGDASALKEEVESFKECASLVYQW